jgi:hypothetical protein
MMLAPLRLRRDFSGIAAAPDDRIDRSRQGDASRTLAADGADNSA